MAIGFEWQKKIAVLKSCSEICKIFMLARRISLMLMHARALHVPYSKFSRAEVTNYILDWIFLYAQLIEQPIFRILSWENRFLFSRQRLAYQFFHASSIISVVFEDVWCQQHNWKSFAHVYSQPRLLANALRMRTTLSHGQIWGNYGQLLRPC